MSPVRAAGSGACRPHPAVFAASLVKMFEAHWNLQAMLSIAIFSDRIRGFASASRAYSRDKDVCKELALVQNPIFTLEAGLLLDVVAQQPRKD